MTTLRTPRLLLRAPADDDRPALLEISRDPQVTRFINAPGVDGAQRAAAFAARVTDHWARFGFGPFAVIVEGGEQDGDLIGLIGVMYPEFMPALASRPELGWRLAPRAWGRGLATEAAAAARDDAFGRLSLPELISIIHPDNAASHRVAARLGMSRDGTVHHAAHGIDVDVWQMPAP